MALHPQYTHAQIDARADSATAKKRMKHWVDLQTTLNNGDFGDNMDAFFHPDMTYGNPSRPDLGTYKQWKTSPEALYRVFPPSRYVTKEFTVLNDNEIWAYCTHHCKHEGGRYMGIEPTGNEFDVEWFSTIHFKDDKIVRIFSIADVLGMFISVGAIDKSKLPVDPYK